MGVSYTFPQIQNIPESLHFDSACTSHDSLFGSSNCKYTNFPTATSTNRLILYPIHVQPEKAAINEKNLPDNFDVT